MKTAVLLLCAVAEVAAQGCGPGTYLELSTNLCMSGVDPRIQRRAGKGGPQIRSEDGNVIIAVSEDGKQVGYRIGDEVVYFDQMQSSIRGQVPAIELGYSLGKKEKGTSDILDYLKTDLSDRVGEIAGAQAKIEATVQTSLDAAAGKATQQLQAAETKANAQNVKAAADLKRTSDTLTASVNTALEKQSTDTATATAALSKDVATLKTQTAAIVKCMGTGLAFNPLTAACCKEGEIYEDRKCVLKVFFSCHDIKEQNSNAQNGFYKIEIDKNWRTWEGKVNSDGTEVEVYCDFYDGEAFTLYEMMCSRVRNDGQYPWNIRSQDTRYPSGSSNIGKMYQSSQNQCARYELSLINSVFKHSKGYVMTRYNNNRDNYHVTDVYGTPEKSLHMLAKEHKCSQKATFNFAKANRQGTSNAYNGFCFNEGKKKETNNCVCGDTTSGTFNLNKCSGGHGNFRRYNGKKSYSKWCRGMAHKCMSYPHGHLGDTYGCNIPGQRNIEGHFWAGLSGRNGMPCSNYGGYGCYGSRWIA